MVIPPSIGVVLVLVGLALFLTDLKVTNHGLPTARAILSLVDSLQFGAHEWAKGSEETPFPRLEPPNGLN
jgi:hypothetical protein